MAGPVRIAILANGGQARAEIRGVATEADLLGRTAGRVGKLLAGAFAVGALARAAGAVYEVGSQYVETLNKIEAITGSTQGQIDKAATALEGQSKQYAKMGETATDAADGVLELTKSGLSLNKALKAVYPTLVLAKSGQLEVSDASALVSNTLNSFNLRASRAGDIANFLANAADASSADVADLAESFKYVAPLASRAGLGLGQTNAILAELANSGIKASQAGTSLRKFLIALQAPTTAASISLDEMGVKIFDAGGKMKPVGQIIKDLSGGLDGLANDQQRAYALKNIFGLTGITGAQVILKGGVQGLKDYSESVRRAGGAARLANATSKGLAGTINQLKAEVVTTAESLYRRYSPAVDEVIRADLPKALDLAKRAAHDLQPIAENLAGAVADFGDTAGDVARGPLGSAFVSALKLTVNLTGKAAALLDSVPEPLRKIAVEAGIAALVLPRLRNGITQIGEQATAQVGKLTALRAEMTLAANGGVPQLSTALAGVSRNSKAVAVDLGAVTPGATTLRNQMLAVQKQAGTTGGTLAGLRVAAEKLGPAAKQAAGIGGLVALTASASESNDALSTLEGTLGAAAVGFSVGGPVGAGIAGAAGLVYELGTKFDDTGEAARAAYRKIAAKDATADAIKSLEQLKSTLDQVTGAYTGATRAGTLKLLTDNKSIEIGAKYGLSAREVVNAALGQKGALSALTPIVADYGSQIDALTAKQKALAANPNNFDDAGFIPAVQKQYVALAEQKKRIEESRAELQNFSASLQGSAREVRATAAATADYSGKLKGLPKSVQTVFNDSGVEASTRAVAKLSAQYKLTPKQIRTVINATGADATVKQVQRVVANIQAANKVKADLPLFKSGVLAAVSNVAKSASQGGEKIASNLKSGTGKARANLNPFVSSVHNGVATATGAASTGGTQVGNALQQGVINGFAGTQARLAAAAAAAVGAAIAAAKARAKIKSPSRETRYIGEMLGEGLAAGMDAKRERNKDSGNKLAGAAIGGVLTAFLRKPKPVNIGGVLTFNATKQRKDGEQAGRDLISEALAGVTNGVLAGSDVVESALSALSDNIEKVFDKNLDRTKNQIKRKYARMEREIKAKLKGKAETRAVNQNDKAADRAENKAEHRANKAQKALNKLTEGYRDQLRANGAQQDQMNDSLQQAKDTLQALVDQAQQYADSIRDAVVASGSLSSLGQGDGFTSIDDLIAKRTSAVARAQQFADTINGLVNAGLNASDIQDLIAQGVEGGLGTAKALLDGGPAAIAQMNTLSAQLAATGTQLGANVSHSLYDAGIQSAQGMVAGLTSQLDALIAAGDAIGQALVKAVKKALKIKSPSRVFEEIGGFTVQGLGQGLDETYVKRQGSDLASSLVKGFGTPALDAYMSTSTTGGGSQPMQIAITLTADQLDQLSRGRAIQADLDAFNRAGGRATS